MGCITILFAVLIGIIFFTSELRPLMDTEGFWLSIGLVWFIFFISWLLFGDIADEIAGVNKYQSDEDEF